MKHNLVKKLALALAATATITATGTLSSCRDSLEAELSHTLETKLGEDISHTIKDIMFIVPNRINDNNYISLIAHSDTGENYSMYYHHRTGYKDHKDYRVTYQVSSEDYLNALNFKYETNDYVYESQLNVEALQFFIDLVDKYDPIEIKEYARADTTDHEYSDEYEFQQNKNNQVTNM